MPILPIRFRFPAVVFCFALLTVSAQAAGPTWTEVSTIFQNRCLICHQGTAAQNGLRLDTLEGVRAGSDYGPVAVPAKPAESELLRRVRGQSLPRMPLTGPPWLTVEEIDTLERWIAAGMPAAATTAVTNAAPEPLTKPRHETPRWAAVAPIFLFRCAKCHSPTGMMGPAPEGVLTTGYGEILARAERARIIPGQPGASEVVRRIKGDSRPRMPLDGPPWLEDAEMTLIEQWIAAGAPDDQGKPAPIPVGARVRFEGKLTGRWEVDGQPLLVGSGTRIDKNPRVGDRVEVRGLVEEDGRIRATRIRSR